MPKRNQLWKSAGARKRTERSAASEFLRHAFFENAQVPHHSLFIDRFAQPAFGFVHFFKTQLEGPVMHRDEPMRAEIFEREDGLIGTHVDVSEGIGVVGADGEKGDLGPEAFANLAEAFEIG